MGQNAESVVATSVTFFSKKNECAVGTSLGDVTLWKGEKKRKLKIKKKL